MTLDENLQQVIRGGLDHRHTQEPPVQRQRPGQEKLQATVRAGL